jgi:hypothetical protein
LKHNLENIARAIGTRHEQAKLLGRGTRAIFLACRWDIGFSQQGLLVVRI